LPGLEPRNDRTGTKISLSRTSIVGDAAASVPTLCCQRTLPFSLLTAFTHPLSSTMYSVFW
jgi:hypothetical protein